VRVAGWTEGEEISALALAERARGLGVAAVVYTDVARDGTGRGPDLEGSRAVAAAAGLPVIVSGGIGSVADVAAVAALAPAGVAGVIIGRALYTGAVRLADALAAAEAKS
jgi:phosphoribosylformimino-5-aminoimidazole carboxamide ribotide isomerase